MSTNLKEWLLTTIAELEEERDATPGAVNEDAAMALEAMKRVLASLEAEPVAYIRDGFRTDGVHFCGGIITAEEHERTKPALSDRYNWKHQPLYTAHPAPSVDDDLLHMAASAIDDLLSNKDRSGAGVWADIPAKLRRAAMLQGAEPVKMANKLPPHIYRELVNRLRDTAAKYQGCQQLREQLSRTLQEVIQPAAPQQEGK